MGVNQEFAAERLTDVFGPNGILYLRVSPLRFSCDSAKYLNDFDGWLRARTDPIESIFPDPDASFHRSVNDQPYLGLLAFANDNGSILIGKLLQPAHEVSNLHRSGSIARTIAIFSWSRLGAIGLW